MQSSSGVRVSSPCQSLLAGGSGGSGCFAPCNDCRPEYSIWRLRSPGLVLFISQGLWGGFLTVPTIEEGFCVYTTVSDITQLVSGHPGGTGTLPSHLFLSPLSLP